MSAYIGPERRKGEDRRTSTYDHSLFFMGAKGIEKDRRPVPEIERRQEGLAGVIAGFSAEDMLLLAGLWKASEEGRVLVAPRRIVMTYDEIIAREA